jgi:serine O-acetyltransferase
LPARGEIGFGKFNLKGGVLRICLSAPSKVTFFPAMKRTPVHPINPHIRNGFVVDFYLNLVRRGGSRRLRRLLEYFLHTEVAGNLPERLHLPHPYGITVGETSKLGEDVTLMHGCNLGPKDPWYQGDVREKIHPTLEEGVYVSMGAMVLGPVTIGAWSVIGANAVVTEDIPPFSTVFGHNRILRTTEGGPPQVKKYLDARKKGNAP